MDLGCWLSAHDRQRILRRACGHWRPHSSLGLLVHLHVLLPVHCLRAPYRFVGGNRLRDRFACAGQAQECTGGDCHLLVHIPSCLLVSHARRQCCISGGVHPDWLLLLRHHFQVRCWLAHLPDLACQITEG